MTDHTFTGTHVGDYDELDDKRRRDDPPGNGRHAADRLRDRLGATGFDVTQLMRETFLENPYSRGGVR